MNLRKTGILSCRGTRKKERERERRIDDREPCERPRSDFRGVGESGASVPERGAGVPAYLETRVNVDPRKAITLNPDVRSAPISALRSVEKCLSSMGLCREDRSRVLDMHPRILTADPELHLYPILDFLINEAGIPYPQVLIPILSA